MRETRTSFIRRVHFALSLGFVLVLNSASSYAGPIDPWKAHGFRFSHITDVIDSDICTQSHELAIMQCVSLIETAFQIARGTKKRVVFTQSPEMYRSANTTFEVSQSYDYGHFLVATISPGISLEEKRQAVARLKSTAKADWLSKNRTTLADGERKALARDLASAWLELLSDLDEAAKASSESYVVAQLMISYMSELDPHAYILSLKPLAADIYAAERVFSEVGLELQIDADTKMPMVQSVPVDGAAYGKLRPGDLIEAVGEVFESAVKTKNIKLHELAQSMAREAGVPLSLWVQRQGKLKSVQLIGDSAKEVLRPIRSALMRSRSARPVNYIDIDTFRVPLPIEEFCRDVWNIRSELVADDDGLFNVLIDLRNNPGGYSKAASCVLQSFQRYLGASVKYRKGLMLPKSAETGMDGALSFHNLDLRVSVLINGSSQSAAELVAGALQSFDDAPVLGTQSKGKGVGQAGTLKVDLSPQERKLFFPFDSIPPEDVLIFRTTGTSFFVSPEGETDPNMGVPSRARLWSHHLIGVTPDIEIRNPAVDVLNGEREIDAYLETSVSLLPTIPHPADPKRAARSKQVETCLADWKANFQPDKSPDPVLETAIEASACAADLPPPY